MKNKVNKLIEKYQEVSDNAESSLCQGDEYYQGAQSTAEDIVADLKELKEEFCMKPSEDSQEKLKASWKTLSEFGGVKLTFESHYPWRDSDISILRNIGELITSMDSFNDKDNFMIGYGFVSFYQKLPTVTRKNTRPGEELMHLFTRITLEGDDTIILEGIDSHWHGSPEHSQLEASINRVLKEYAKRWHIDECDLKVEPHPVVRECTTYQVRLWWD